MKKPPLCNGATATVSTPVGIRTPNLLIRSQTLYPVELRAHEQLGKLSFPEEARASIARRAGLSIPFLREKRKFLTSRRAKISE